MKQQPKRNDFYFTVVAVISITLIFIITVINLIFENGLHDYEFINLYSNNLFAQVKTLLFGGAALYCFFIFYIFHSRRQKQKELEKMAFYDNVTGIKNSIKFEKDAAEILKKNRSKKYAIIILDVDKFTIIDDICGYKAGDKLLCDIAEALQELINKNKGLYAHLAADAFEVLIKYEDQKDIIDFINRFINYAHKINCNNIAEKPSFSFGIYKIDDRTVSVRKMVDRAALALETAKSKCVNDYAFFDESVRNKLLWHKEVEDEMVKALNQNEFIVYLQPKYQLSDNSISSAEALVRWNSPKFGLLSPNYFIPIFEKNCFIIDLDFYVLEQVCKQLRVWINKGITPFPVAVNISRKHLGRPNFVEKIHECIKKYDIPPNLIELELTETAVYNNLNVITKLVDRLHKLGIKLSMDDFGSGYSSLNTLKCLDFDVLKLDREFFFISSPKEQKRSEIVINSIINMAKQLNITTVAEGVEIKEQVDYLKKIGCDTVQGYYFAKPMTIGAFEKIAY